MGGFGNRMKSRMWQGGVKTISLVQFVSSHLWTLRHLPFDFSLAQFFRAGSVVFHPPRFPALKGWANEKRHHKSLPCLPNRTNRRLPLTTCPRFVHNKMKDRDGTENLDTIVLRSDSSSDHGNEPEVLLPRTFAGFPAIPPQAPMFCFVSAPLLFEKESSVRRQRVAE